MKSISKTVITAILFIAMTACGGKDSRKLYSSEKFTLYGDRVVQGEYTAVAVSDNKLVSDYQSPANAFFNPLISYKFSINGRDNEAPSGQDHQAVLKPSADGKIIIQSTFGEKDKALNPVNQTDEAIPANTPVRFEVDMRKVMEAFEKNGFFTDFNGNKIFKSDFKGLWIAGGTVPMSWDFENLPGRDDLKLTDADGDGIYSCDLVFNVYNPDSHTSTEKVMTTDVTRYPYLKTPFPVMNALYRMSLEELMLDIRPDSTFMAGKEWNGVWTRDISYSIILSLAAIEPDIARKSLMRKVSNNHIIQDTGSGGSWPVSTDREVWALAAWEIFKTTGDREWLEQAYQIIDNSIKNDFQVAFNPATGLFYGESSFLDWRKQTYPVWMEPIDIYHSHNLGTNAVFYMTLSILSEMGKILDVENDYQMKATNLKDSINSKLWSDDKNFYGQYLYGHYDYSLSPRSESLGEALCVLFDIAGEDRKEKMFTSVPEMDYGITCIYPQIPGIPPYHNNAIWPFVQAYWTWAGARERNTAVVEHGIASIYRQAALFLTNKENMVAESGDFNGTEINSDYQLWSVAADLAVIYRVIFGMEYEAERLVFKPFIPERYNGSYVLNGLKYRQAILDITIDKYGDEIASFKLDGEKVTSQFIPASLTGRHSVHIIMNERLEQGKVNIVENTFSPATPETNLTSGQISWKAVGGATNYKIFRNGKFLTETPGTSCDINNEDAGEYQVLAVDANGVCSFLSKPLQFNIYEKSMILEAEHFAKVSGKEAFGFSGGGFVEIRKKNEPFVFSVNAPSDGNYIIEFRYSNGNGPVNTDNKCAQRSLFCNGKYYGSAIFPQRGRDEWSDWGLSNPLTVSLKKGVNRLELRFEEFNNSMNFLENSFLLDYIRCFPEERIN
jgi:hypothetical protein